MTPPAFQFYPADFLVGVAGMTNEQVGVYIKLLCYQWAKGGIPNDFTKLCAMTSCSEVRVVTECLQKFELKDDVFRNQKLESVRQNHIKWITKSSEGGKKSALKRWGSRHKKRLRVVTPCLPFGCNQSGNQSVTLQSSSSIYKKVNQRKGRAESEKDVVDYALSLGLKQSDGEFFWNTQESGGWTRGGKPLVDWKASLRTWKTAGWLPSQKNPQGNNGHKESKSGQWADSNKHSKALTPQEEERRSIEAIKRMLE